MARKINLDDTIVMADPTGLTQGATALCRNVSGEIAVCSSNALGVTLQQAYNAGNTIAATDVYGNIDFSLASGNARSFTVTNAGTATSTLIIDDTDSGATHNAINIESAGTSKFTITELGALTTSGSIVTTGSGNNHRSHGLTVSANGASITGGINNNSVVFQIPVQSPVQQTYCVRHDSRGHNQRHNRYQNQ